MTQGPCSSDFVPLEPTRRSGDGGFVAELCFDGPAVAPVPFKASLFTLAPGGHSRLDRHDVRELWIVVGGHGRMTVSERVLDLRAGDAISIASRDPHQVRNPGSVPLMIVSIWWGAS